MIFPNSLRAAAAKNRRPKQPSLPLTGVRRSPRQLHIASSAAAGDKGIRCLYFTSNDIAGTGCKRNSLPLTGDRRSPRQQHIASSSAAGDKGSRCLYFTSNDITGTDCKRNSLPLTGNGRLPRQLHIASSATSGVAGADRFDYLMTEVSRALCFTSPHAIEVQTPVASIYPSKMMSGRKHKSDVATVPKMSGGKQKKIRGLSPSNDANKAMEEESSDSEDDKDCDYVPVTNAAIDNMMCVYLASGG